MRTHARARTLSKAKATAREKTHTMAIDIITRKRWPRVLHGRFDTFVRCVYSILCPLVPGALSGNKKLKRRTVVIQKELLVSYSIIIVAAILPLRVS